MIEPLECLSCHEVYELDEFSSLCQCGGLLHIPASGEKMDAAGIDFEAASLWRYKNHFFPKGNEDWKEITMGEGFTPLIPLDADNPSIMLKLEYFAPFSGVYDRGFAAMAAMLKDRGMIETEVSPMPHKERLAWRAYTHRARIKEAVTDSGKLKDSYYYLPFFLAGIQTFVYEIGEQLTGKKLEFIVFPAAAPAFIIGAFLGFKQLMESEEIEEYPAFLLVERDCVKNENDSAFANEYIEKILAITKGKRMTVAQSEITQALKALEARFIKSTEDDALIYAGFMRYYRDFSIKDQLAILPIGYMNGGR